MPGKVNPTQCEAVTMVCAQVRNGRDVVSQMLPDDGSSLQENLSGFGGLCFECLLGMLFLLVGLPCFALRDEPQCASLALLMFALRRLRYFTTVPCFSLPSAVLGNHEKKAVG